ncbi:MAG: hypothetical protein ACKN9T_04285 [Candidatus Methylumidiphilus sp.]
MNDKILWQNLYRVYADFSDYLDDLNAESTINRHIRNWMLRELTPTKLELKHATDRAREAIDKVSERFSWNPDAAALGPADKSTAQPASQRQSVWDSANPADHAPVEIPLFVAQRLALVVRYAVLFTNLVDPEHAAFLLKALGESDPAGKLKSDQADRLNIGKRGFLL